MTPHSRTERALHAIAALAGRPWCLCCVMLFANALARPYAGIIHDAQLYSVQVLNQLQPGTYADDLFFRYGSQDRYSIFSRCAAPLVAVIGLPAAFFLLYVVFNTLFIIALQRLVEALIRDRLASTLALVFMVVTPLTFGGLGPFHVQEDFLTPRLIANALTLFALERTLRQRYGAALVFLIPALALHPVMAAGGVLIWAGCLAWQILPRRAFLLLFVAGIAASAWFLATPSIAARFLGTMDEEWRQIIVRATPFIFPTEWVWVDWLNIALGLIVVAVFAFSSGRADTHKARFLWVVALVSVVAVVGTCLAESLPYALLLQGQPYRALWILKVVQIPLALWLAVGLLRMDAWYGPFGGVILLGGLGLTTSLMVEWLFPLFFLGILIVRYRGLGPMPVRADWWRRSLVTSLLLGFASCALYKLILLSAGHAVILRYTNPLEYGRILTGAIGPIPWLLIFALFVTWAARRTGMTWRFGLCLLALTVLIQGSVAAILAAPAFRANYTRYGKDICFAEQFLQRRHDDRVPTIYSCLGRLDLVWLDLHAKSYFDWWQMSGVIFDRRMALEAQRRALVVGPFELDRFRVAGLVPDITRKQASRFFALDFDKTKPELANLRALCREKDVDYLLLTQEFPGLVAASNGRVFLYDCREVRTALGSAGAGIARARRSFNRQ